MTFSDKLYTLRTQYGYSQESLAEKLGVSRQAISKWELGTAMPDTEKVIAISDTFDVSIDSLLKDNISINENESLDRVVIKFLGSAQDMDVISKELLDIVKDGVIDDQEKVRMDGIIDTLDQIASIINEIKQKMNIQDICRKLMNLKEIAFAIPIMQMLLLKIQKPKINSLSIVWTM